MEDVAGAAPQAEPSPSVSERKPEHLFDVVDRLAALNERASDPDLQVSLVDLRLAAAELAEPPSGAHEWPPQYADPFPDHSEGLPEIHSSELTAEVLGGAVAHHGALVVRDIFDPRQVSDAVKTIEEVHRMRAQAQKDDALASAPDSESWFRPVRTETPMRTAALRKMVGEQGGTWLADSPVATAYALQELRASGVIDAISGHLGERPYFSLQKSTLRRSLPEPRIVGWHQDGSFLGPEVRTMNVWVALTPCGGDLPTPGLEVVPTRIEELLPLGSNLTKHSIPFEVVDEIAESTPTIVPEFAPGDGLLFDQKFLHRTHLPPSMTEIRYALECWFFAPSHHAPEYVPLLA